MRAPEEGTGSRKMGRTTRSANPESPCDLEGETPWQGYYFVLIEVKFMYYQTVLKWAIQRRSVSLQHGAPPTSTQFQNILTVPNRNPVPPSSHTPLPPSPSFWQLGIFSLCTFACFALPHQRDLTTGDLLRLAPFAEQDNLKIQTRCSGSPCLVPFCGRVIFHCWIDHILCIYPSTDIRVCLALAVVNSPRTHFFFF